MSDDDRTSEQKAADDNLSRAVRRVMDAYDETEPGAVIAHFMVLVEQRGWNAAGEPVSGLSTLMNDGTMPWPNIIGMLRMAQLQFEKDWVRQ